MKCSNHKSTERAFLHFLLLFLIFVFIGCANIRNSQYEFTHYSEEFTIDQYFRPGSGPKGYYDIELWKSEKPELLWIRGVKQELIGDDGVKLATTENLCHGHFRFKSDRIHEERPTHLLGNTSHGSYRLFTISQGMEEMIFPAGFGIPVHSKEPFEIGAMLENRNYHAETKKINVKTTVYFDRQNDLKEAIKPLFLIHSPLKVPVMFPLPDGPVFVKINTPYETIRVPAMKPVIPPNHRQRSKKFYYTRFWLIPPGRHEFRYPLMTGLNLRFNTSIQFIAVHLHVFAESLELIDRTDNKIIFKSNVKNFDDISEISKLEYYADKDGIPVYKDHDYELLLKVHNVTTQEIDMMAIMYLFLLDKNFDISQVRLEEVEG